MFLRLLRDLAKWFALNYIDFWKGKCTFLHFFPYFSYRDNVINDVSVSEQRVERTTWPDDYPFSADIRMEQNTANNSWLAPSTFLLSKFNSVDQSHQKYENDSWQNDKWVAEKWIITSNILLAKLQTPNNLQNFYCPASNLRSVLKQQ